MLAPLALSIALLGTACGGYNLQPTTESMQQELFETSCIYGPCHNSGDREGGLNLEADVAMAEMVGVLSDHSDLVRIQPGDHTLSFLYYKLSGELAADEGAIMPLGGRQLSANELAVVAEWINSMPAE